MEKMDIQAERRNTAEAKEKLKKYQQEAEEKLGKYQQEAEKKIEDIQRKHGEEIQRKHIEDIITMSKEYGADKPSITEKLIEKCGLNRYEAEEAIAQYWKE